MIFAVLHAIQFFGCSLFVWIFSLFAIARASHRVKKGNLFLRDRFVILMEIRLSGVAKSLIWEMSV